MQIPAYAALLQGAGSESTIVDMGDGDHTAPAQPTDMPVRHRSHSLPNLGDLAQVIVHMGVEEPQTCFSPPTCTGGRRHALLATKYSSYCLMIGSILTSGVTSAALCFVGMVLFEGQNLTASCCNSKTRSTCELVVEGWDHVSNIVYLVGNGVTMGVALGTVPATVGGLATGQLVSLAKVVSIVPVTAIHEVLVCLKPCRTAADRCKKIAGHVVGAGLALLGGFAGVGVVTDNVSDCMVYGLAGTGVGCLVAGSVLNDCVACGATETEEEASLLAEGGSSYGSTSHRSAQNDHCIIEMGEESGEDETCLTSA